MATVNPLVGYVDRQKRDSPYRVQVLERSLAILDLLAEAPEELGPAELAGRLSLHKSTIHRLLMVLEQHRFTHRNPRLGKYGLGTRLFELGKRAVAQIDLPERAQPFLRRLVEEVEETAHVCVMTGTEVLSVTNIEAPRQIRELSTIARRSPVHCTAGGKAVIAFLPPDELAQLIARLPMTRYTRHTLTTIPALKTELLNVRRRGIAFDNMEFEEGVRSVGAPVLDYTGRVIAALSITGPPFRLTNGRCPRLVHAVKAVARDFSRDLGYTTDGAAFTEPQRQAKLQGREDLA